MIDKTILQREKKRFSEALANEYSCITAREIGKLYENGETPEENSYDVIQRQLRISYALSSELLEVIFKETMAMTTEVEGIAKWDRYIAALHLLFARSKNSLLIKSLSLFGLDSAKQDLYKFIDKAHSILPLLRRFFSKCNTYFTTYDEGIKIADNANFSEELVPTYASLKTWKTNIDFDDFKTSYKDLAISSIRIYIEGPIQLYLELSSKHFLVFIKTLLFERLSDEMKGLKDLQLFNDHIRSIIQDSKVMKYAFEILENGIGKGIDNWIDEQTRWRLAYPSPEAKSRFIKNFEDGVYTTVAKNPV